MINQTGPVPYVANIYNSSTYSSNNFFIPFKGNTPYDTVNISKKPQKDKNKLSTGAKWGIGTAAVLALGTIAYVLTKGKVGSDSVKSVADFSGHIDFMPAKTVEEAINFGKGYDLAICHKQKTEILDEDTSSSIPVHFKEVTRENLFRDLFIKDNPIIWKYYSHNVWNKLYRKRVIENLRFKPFVVAQDREFLIRLYMTVKEAILVDSFLYFWVQHPESIMHSPSYLLRRSMCHVKMDYDNYTLFSGEEFRQYKNLLLEDLYNHILIWRELAWFTPARKDVCKECKTFLNHTWKKF